MPMYLRLDSPPRSRLDHYPIHTCGGIELARKVEANVRAGNGPKGRCAIEHANETDRGVILQDLVPPVT